MLDYNLFRDHEVLGGRTPGEAAGVNAPFKEWAEIVRGASPKDRGAITRKDPRAVVVPSMLLPTQSARNRRSPTPAEYRFKPQTKSTPARRGRGGHDRRLVGPREKS